MSERQVTFELLNAYVDGELDTAAAAEVAKAIAEDTALAREVAALSRLRSAVADSVEAPPLSLPAPRRFGARGMAIAASVAFALLVAGSVLVSSHDRNVGADWLARAWEIHRGWSIEEESHATLLPARYAESVPGAFVPDLSASRLSFVHAALSSFSKERQVLLAGYRGSRGCKISLMVFQSLGVLDEALRPIRDGKMEAYGWRAGALGYVIMSDGMDSDRFRLLAESVRHTSHNHVPFDEKTRTALRESRDKSAPCLA